MHSRRRYVAALLGAVAIPTAGCSALTDDPDEPAQDAPQRGDLAGEVLRPGESHPDSDRDADEEMVLLENESERDVSLYRSVVEYPDGHAYEFGEFFDRFSVPPGSSVEVRSSDTDTLKTGAPPVFTVGTEHPDPPALRSEGRVRILAPDGTEVWSTEL